MKSSEKSTAYMSKINNNVFIAACFMYSELCYSEICYMLDSAGATFLFFFPIRLINDFDIKYGFSGVPSFRSRSSRKHKKTVLTAISYTLKKPSAIM